MAKRKNKLTSSSNDNRVAGIVLGLFVAALILFFIFSKAKESHQEKAGPVSNEQAVQMNQAPQPIPEETSQNLSGGGRGKIAFIIDDWGQTTMNCKYLKEIPDPMAVSILPGLRHTKDVAACARLYHKVAMLHLPLEAMRNYDFYYPPNYLIKTTMSPELVTQIVDGDLAQLPSIEGVNNHMGSKATADRSLMRVIFKRIKKKGLFFVDSMTSPRSVSARLAEEMGLSYAKRDVFLDNVNTQEAITKQIMILAQKARRRGYAIAIGHDRRLTMQVLKEEIPLLKNQGFEIVSIKDLLKNK